MNCVSRWRATGWIALFTFTTVAPLGGGLAGCAAQTSRVLLHPANGAEPAKPQTASTVLAEPVADPELPVGAAHNGLTVANRLTMQGVPPVQLKVRWDVRFGQGCFIGSGLDAGGAPSVEILGDLVAEGYGLRVKLDGGLSRAVPLRGVGRTLLAVTKLADPWLGIQPGRHRLAVYAARAADGQIPLDDSGAAAVSFCEFQVDQAGRTSPVVAQPDVALLGPEGTFYGDALGNLLIQLFLVPSQGELTHPRATLVVVHPDGNRDVHSLAHGAYRASSATGAKLSGGDYALWAELSVVVSEPTSSATVVDEQAPKGPGGSFTKHIVTINPE